MRHRKGSQSYLNRRGGLNGGHNSDCRNNVASPNAGHNYVETSKPIVGFPPCDNNNNTNVNISNQANNVVDVHTLPSAMLQPGPECGRVNNAAVYSDNHPTLRNALMNYQEMNINSNKPSMGPCYASNNYQRSDNGARDCIVQHCYDMPFVTHTPIPSVIPVYDMSGSSYLRDVNISGYINCAPQLASFAIPLQLTLQPSSGLVVNQSSGLTNQPTMVSTVSRTNNVNTSVTVTSSHGGQSLTKPTVFVAPTKSELKDHVKFMESTYFDKTPYDLIMKNTKFSSNTGFVKNDKQCSCGNNSRRVDCRECCEMGSNSVNVRNDPLETIDKEVCLKTCDKNYTCTNPAISDIGVLNYEKFEQAIGYKSSMEPLQLPKINHGLKQSKLNPGLNQSKLGSIVNQSKVEPLSSYHVWEKMKNSVNEMSLVVSQCQAGTQPDMNNNVDNRQVIDKMNNTSMEGRCSDSLKKTVGTMDTHKKGLYRPWELTKSSVISNVQKGSKFKTWFEQRCNKLPDNASKQHVDGTSHIHDQSCGSNNSVGKSFESGLVAKELSVLGHRSKQAIDNDEDDSLKLNVKNDGVTTQLSVTDRELKTVSGDKVDVNTEKSTLDSSVFDFKTDIVRNRLKKLSENSVLSAKKLVFYKELNMNTTDNMAELAHLQMKDFTTSTVTMATNNRNLKAINNSVIGKRIKVTEVVFNKSDTRVVEDKTVADAVVPCSDITETSGCNKSVELIPTTYSSKCNMMHVISQSKLTSTEDKCSDGSSELQSINNDELHETMDHIDQKAMTKVDKQVSILKSMSVAILNENNIDKETTIGCKTTEYFSSKLNTELIRVNEMNNETHTVSNEYVLSTRKESSDNRKMSTVAPVDCSNNSELPLSFVQPKNDPIQTCSVKPQKSESHLPSLPSTHQACSLPDSICLNKLNDRHCTISQMFLSSGQNETWFCPTMEEYETYKNSLVQTPISLAITSSQQYNCNGNNTVATSSVPFNLNTGPKILNYQSLSDPTQQVLTDNVNESTEQSNSLVAFGDEIQDTPKEIFDEIVEDILKDPDLMNSISAEDTDKVKEAEEEEEDDDDDIIVIDDTDLDTDEGLFQHDGNIDINNNCIRRGVRFMGNSRRPYRYQKRFPKPLPCKRPYRVERDLYVAAEKFLGEDFDKSKRTRRHSSKDSSFLVSPTTGKMELVKSDSKDSEKPKTSSVFKKLVDHDVKVVNPNRKRKVTSEFEQTDTNDGMKTRKYYKNKVKNDSDIYQASSSSYVDKCNDETTERGSDEVEKHNATKSADNGVKKEKKVSPLLIKTVNKIPTLQIKPVKIDSKERLKKLKMMLKKKLKPFNTKSIKSENTKSMELKDAKSVKLENAKSIKLENAKSINAKSIKLEKDDLCETYKVKKSSLKDKDQCIGKKKCCSTCTSGCTERYVCEVCNYPCDSSLAQRLHLNNYHPLWCSICTRLCPDADSKMEHLRTAHDIAATCKVCGKNFSYMKKYNLHLHSQYHADNMLKYSQLMKQVWAARKARRKDEVIIISDDDFSGTDGSAHSVETKQKCSTSISTESKGKKRKMTEESEECVTKSLGHRRMPFDYKLKERVVAQYCHVCKQFYMKFKEHKNTVKHKQNVIHAEMLLQEKTQKKM